MHQNWHELLQTSIKPTLSANISDSKGALKVSVVSAWLPWLMETKAP